MSDFFSSASSAANASPSSFGEFLFNPSNVRFGSPAQPVLSISTDKVFFGVEAFDESRSEVLVAGHGEGFGLFMAELLSDYQLGLTRMVSPEGRTVGALIFAGQEKVLVLAFDAHSKANHKVLLDWKKHQSIQLTVMTDIGDICLTQQLTNSIIDKLLTVKTNKVEQEPTSEIFAAMKMLTGYYGQFSQVVTTLMVPCNAQAS